MFEDAVDTHARGDNAKALRLIRPLAARLAPPGTPATSTANRDFVGDGAVVSYLNNKGDNHETYGDGIGHCVRALQHLRVRLHSSSRVERQDPSNA
jgi:hypothetical protein